MIKAKRGIIEREKELLKCFFNPGEIGNPVGLIVRPIYATIYVQYGSKRL